MDNINQIGKRDLWLHLIYIVVSILCISYLDKTYDITYRRLFAAAIIYLGGFYWIYFFLEKREFQILIIFLIYFIGTYFLPIADSLLFFSIGGFIYLLIVLFLKFRFLFPK